MTVEELAEMLKVLNKDFPFDIPYSGDKHVQDMQVTLQETNVNLARVGLKIEYEQEYGYWYVSLITVH